MERPEVVLNGAPLPARPRSVKIDRETAWVIPLRAAAGGGDPAARVRRARELLELSASPKVHESYVRDWQIVGPFPGDPMGAVMGKPYPPEAKIDLTAAYEGADGKPVKWLRTAAGGSREGPVNLLQFFPEAENVCGYAATVIHSDAARDLALWVGVEDLGRTYCGWVREPLALWLNGEKLMATDAYESPGRDGLRVAVRLKAGENSVLVKFAHAKEVGGLNLFLRVADPWGFPAPEGIRCEAPGGGT
jgi:hypothetical protein